MPSTQTVAEIDTRCVKAMVCGDFRKRGMTARAFRRGKVYTILAVCRLPGCGGAEEM